MARASHLVSLLGFQLTVQVGGESCPQDSSPGSQRQDPVTLIAGITQEESSKFMAVCTGLLRDWPLAVASGARLQALLDFYTWSPKSRKCF